MHSWLRMTDAIVLDAINREQFATPADHLLLCGRPSARRAHNARRAANARIAMLAHDDRFQRGAVAREHEASSPLALGVRSPAADSPARRPPRARGRGLGRLVFAFGVAIPTLVGVGLAVAALC